jgi:hypothetical protein
MRKRFSNFGDRLSGFMQGRYGYDELSRFMSAIGIIIMVISLFPHLHFLYTIGFALLILSLLRSLSRNIYKRQMERNKYLSLRSKPVQKIRIYKKMWRERKTHEYYKCPGCKAYVRITKPGKGRRIMVTCPKCRQSFEERT